MDETSSIGVPPSAMAKDTKKSNCGCGENKEGGDCGCKHKNRIKPLEVVLVIAILGGAYYLLKK